MTPKLLRYSAHAAGRLRERRITRQAVRRILATGTREIAPPKYGRDRWVVWGAWRREPLGIVFVESATEIYLITVMWKE